MLLTATVIVEYFFLMFYSAICTEDTMLSKISPQQNHRRQAAVDKLASKMRKCVHYVVVQNEFILGLNFIFLLFLGMVVYENEFETMENKI